MQFLELFRIALQVAQQTEFDGGENDRERHRQRMLERILTQYDKLGAEEKLNLALAADPNNQEVIDKMLKMWEKDPAKREQVANVYETVLERNPSDLALRKKLADLFFDMNRTEDATRNYLELYRANDQFKSSPQIQERLISGLGKLHLQFARAKDYKQAIIYYKLLAAIDPKTDPAGVVSYEYLQQSAAIKPGDTAARLALAQYAQKSGLDAEALDGYKRLLDDPKTHDAAQAGLDHYAQARLSDIQSRVQAGDFLLARTLSEQAQQEFPTSTKVQAALAGLIGRINAEIAADNRKKEVLAKDVLKRADEFYAQGMQALRSILDTQLQNQPLLYSPREDAKRYFLYAIEAYKQVLSIDPALGTASNSLVNIRLNECQEYYRRLTQPLIPQRSTFDPYFNTPNNGR